MKSRITFALVTCMVVMLAGSAHAGVKYEDGDKYIKIGGRIQLQYHIEEPDGGDREDELFFRRLRPYIEGSVHEDWKGKFQWDMGKSKTEIKDAYLQYKGVDGLAISVGNHNFPFSRELLTSSKKQQLVERTFVGDHNYGTPDRQAGIHLTGNSPDKLITWGASLALGAVDPSNKKLDFDTVISLNKGSDWSEGPMLGARVDFFPAGHFKFSQASFNRDDEFKVGFGLAAFTWSNDDDNLDATREDDVDSVTGFEVSAAVRGMGLSVDVQYNSFDSELVDAGITSGLYSNSESTLENYAVEAGYMLAPERFEVVVGYQSQDADNYSDSWNRTSVGANLYFKKHDIKLQLTHRMGENKDGKTDHDVDETFLQMQYVV